LTRQEQLPPTTVRDAAGVLLGTTTASRTVPLPEETERARVTLKAVISSALVLLSRGSIRSVIATVSVRRSEGGIPGPEGIRVRRWYELDGDTWISRHYRAEVSCELDAIWWNSVLSRRDGDDFVNDLGTVYLARSDRRNWPKLSVRLRGVKTRTLEQEQSGIKHSIL
jgi:hypothetical protein